MNDINYHVMRFSNRNIQAIAVILLNGALMGPSLHTTSTIGGSNTNKPDVNKNPNPWESLGVENAESGSAESSRAENKKRCNRNRIGGAILGIVGIVGIAVIAIVFSARGSSSPAPVPFAGGNLTLTSTTSTPYTTTTRTLDPTTTRTSDHEDTTLDPINTTTLTTTTRAPVEIKSNEFYDHEFSIEIDGFYDKIYGKICNIITSSNETGTYTYDYSQSYIKDSPYTKSQSDELREGISNGISKIFSQWNQNQKLTSSELFEIIGIKTWGEKCSEFKCNVNYKVCAQDVVGLVGEYYRTTIGYVLNKALNLFREIQNSPSIVLIKRVQYEFYSIMTAKTESTDPLTSLYDDHPCLDKAILNLEKIYMILFFQFQVIKCIQDKDCDRVVTMKNKLRNLGDYIAWNINKGLNTNDQKYFQIARCAWGRPDSVEKLIPDPITNAHDLV